MYSVQMLQVINKPEVYKGALNDMQGLNAVRMHRHNILNGKVAVVTSDPESYNHLEPYNNNNDNNNNRLPPTKMNFAPIRKRCLWCDPKLNYSTSSDTLKKEFEFIEFTSTPRKEPFYPSQSNNTRMPVYRNHQLLGDSQLLRLSEHFLDYRHFVTTTPDRKSKCLGYCVSGQKIADLKRRLSQNEYSVEPNVILMIGTHDFIQGTPLLHMYIDFTTMLNNLTVKAGRIVILTIPPVPKLGNGDHITNLQQFNNFLLSHHDGNQVYVVDMASIYIGFNNTAQMVYFDFDQIHINKKGLKLLIHILDTLYFNNFNNN